MSSGILAYHSMDGFAIKRGNYQAAGIDLTAYEKTEVCQFEVTAIDTGITLAIPKDYFGLVTLRSGFSTKNGILMINAPGIIDEDYRGKIIVNVIKLTTGSYTVSSGQRFAQIIILPYSQPYLMQHSNLFDLTGTERGSGGFGSTGF